MILISILYTVLNHTRSSLPAICLCDKNSVNHCDRVHLFWRFVCFYDFYVYVLLMVHLRLVCSRQYDLRPRHARSPVLVLAYERSENNAVEK